MAASRACAAAAPSLPTYWCLELLHECFPELALPPLLPTSEHSPLRSPPLQNIFLLLAYAMMAICVANSLLCSEMAAGAPEGYRHRIELRALEAWLESVGVVPKDPTPPPAPAAGASASQPSCILSASCSPREVLGRLHLYFAGEFREGQNIPWRKIKKYGEGIFNKERSPADLKDKWRNLKKRAKIP
uniref:Myb-like domain-containing protein n=1 Tax=Oryza brachyantha TaxID=4533 RepID=J3L7V6_ORYBR